MNSLESKRPGLRHGSRRTWLTIGAVGVVFGDIGTSPLYTLQAVFAMDPGAGTERETVFGVVSMIIWLLIIIVTLSYVTFITRADNDGEGGILSLAALLLRQHKPSKTLPAALLIGMVGTALFLGDAVITPAISVLSAAEGLTVVNEGLSSITVLLAAAVLTGLFAIQHHGTARIGASFGPIMVGWFLLLAILGVRWIAVEPSVLWALSPTYAINFAISRPLAAFVALGLGVLAVTGAEALYADLGHFGRKAISHAWVFIVFPALVVNYLGQGALLISNPSAVRNPFFELAPRWSLIPVIVVATMATVIASQSVISGAFSVVRQSVRSHLLPRLRVMQTSQYHGGQIYIPAVNWLLYAGVIALVFGFGSSEKLAGAYGLSVTGTLLLEFILFCVFAHRIWHWRWYQIAGLALLVGTLEGILFVSNTLKIVHGGWLPLTIAALLLTVMGVWHRGARITFGQREQMEGSLTEFLDSPIFANLTRSHGLAVYPHGNSQTVPLALHAAISFANSIPEKIIIVTVKNVGVPRVAEEDQLRICDFGWEERGVIGLEFRVGFRDSQDVPHAVRLFARQHPEYAVDPTAATYVLSVFRIEPSDERHPDTWPQWQRHLFRTLERLSANRTHVFHLPPERTIVLGSEILV